MFKGMKLGTRIVAGFGCLIALVSLAGGIDIWNLRRAGARSEALTRRSIPRARSAGKLARSANQMVLDVESWASGGRRDGLEKGRSGLADARRSLRELEESAASAGDPELKESCAAAAGGLREYEEDLGQASRSRDALEASLRRFTEDWGRFERLCGEAFPGGPGGPAAPEELVRLAGEIPQMGSRIRAAHARALEGRGPGPLEDALKDFDALARGIERLRGLIPGREKAPGGAEEIASVARDARDVLRDAEGKLEELRVLDSRRGERAERLLGIANALALREIDACGESAEDASSTLASSTVLIAAGLAASVLVGLFLTLRIASGITASLRGIFKGLKGFSREELEETEGEIRSVIASMTRGSEQASAAAAQVAQASQRLAEGASEQAACLEETSSSIRGFTSMVEQNADNAKQANRMAREACDAAEKSQDAVSRMNAAILRIKESSVQTARIIRTIDEIAFQTNLLALNAAVEAARAGDAGKGFAVVADEVRGLARRSAEAAKNTAALIKESQENAENGVQVSREVSAVLKEIGFSIQKVTHLAAEVAAASDEQTRGIEQMNSAVREMDRVTQSNASGAEESASASEELSIQARELSDMVEVLDGIMDGHSARGRRPPPRPEDPRPARSSAARGGGAGSRREARGLSSRRRPEERDPPIPPRRPEEVLSLSEEELREM